MSTTLHPAEKSKRSRYPRTKDNPEVFQVTTSDLRQDLAEILNRVAYHGDKFALDRRGKAIAAIVPIETLKLLELLEDRLDAEAAAEALAEAERDGFIPWEKVKADLGLRSDE